jgi:PAS domain-containing protein
MPSPDDHREIRRGPLEHFADRLVAGMSDAIVYADAEGVIRFWNRGATRVFGFTETEALGRSLDFIIPEGLRERHWHGYRATMRTGQSRYGGGEILSVPALAEGWRSGFGRVHHCTIHRRCRADDGDRCHPA